MLKLSDIEFTEYVTDYGIELEAKLVLTKKSTITRASMNMTTKKGEEKTTELMPDPSGIILVYKENLTQAIIEEIYGGIKDDFYRLLEIAQMSPEVNTNELNVMYERLRAYTG